MSFTAMQYRRWFSGLLGRNETLFILLTISLIWTGSLLKLSHDRNVALTTAETTSRNIARLIEQNIIHAVGELDKALLYLRARYDREKRDFDLADTAHHWALITNITVQMAHIAPDGMMLATTVKPAPKGRIDLKDREHFKAHLDNPKDFLFISKPLLGRASGKWSVQLSRKIIGADGAFEGVFVVSLDPAAVSSFYKSIDLGEGSVIALLGEDGVVRASNNETVSGIGTLGAAAFGDIDQKLGETRVGRLVDSLGTARRAAYRSVDGYPLYVLAGVAEREALGDFHREAIWFMGGITVLSLILMMTAVMNHGRQRARLHANLLAVRERRSRQHNAELMTANANINELNVELSRAVLSLKEAQEEILRKGRLAQLGQLTATVAHEIRNPLGSIQNAAYVIERKIDPEALGLEKPFTRLKSGIKRCDKIITELLDFARSKSLILRRATVDEWLREVVQEEAAKLPPKIKLVQEYECGPLVAEFDSDRMRRVVINLLSNASEALTEMAAAKPEAASRPLRMKISSRQIGSNIEIVVTDNGPGIATENLARIREPLFTTKSFGVGLGIPAVEKILELHGGGLKISSTLGQGATFIATFPVEQAERKLAA